MATKLDQLNAYIGEWMPAYRKMLAHLTEWGTVNRPANILPVARMWFEAGVPAVEAVAWFAAGVTPADAAKRIKAGEPTPTRHIGE